MVRTNLCSGDLGLRCERNLTDADHHFVPIQCIASSINYLAARTTEFKRSCYGRESLRGQLLV